MSTRVSNWVNNMITDLYHDKGCCFVQRTKLLKIKIFILKGKPKSRSSTSNFQSILTKPHRFTCMMNIIKCIDTLKSICNSYFSNVPCSSFPLPLYPSHVHVYVVYCKANAWDCISPVHGKCKSRWATIPFS